MPTLCSLLVLAAALSAPSPAQMEPGDFVIRVNSRDVVVPVTVTDKEMRTEQIVVGNQPMTYSTSWVNGLTAKNFRVFEDGIEQKVESVTAEQVRWWPTLDNIGEHMEYSLTPRGVWATSDAERMGLRGVWATSDEERMTPRGSWATAATPLIPFFQNIPMWRYMVSYIPPTSSEGACHSLKVTVNRKNTNVNSREEYCSTPNSPDDPLNGSAVNKQLAKFADSEDAGAFPILGQVIAFGGGPSASKLEIVLEFPEGRNPGVSGTGPAWIEVLGMVYDKNGNLVRRFSDSSGFFMSTKVGASNAIALFQFRYEMQTTLSAGDYDLKIVATDGKKFGRMKRTIEIPQFQSKPLDISGVALCRRYRKPLDGQAKKLRPTEFSPLLAKGMEFTPTGDTHFSRDEQLVAFLEIYRKQNQGTASPRIYLETKVTDPNTDKLEFSTGLHPVDSDVQPDLVIPVVLDLAIAKLPPGTHRMEMQASDSSGNKTAWRVTTFLVE